MDIAGRVALVTGGASGLGRATAEVLAAAGADVVICDLPSSDGEAVAKDLPGQARFAPADVTSEQDVTAAVELAAELGPLRILVNCAGIGVAGRVVGKRGPLPLELFAKVLAVNVTGTFNVLRLAAAKMLECELEGEERGVIVNTSSVAAYDGQIGQVAYATSKAAVAGMTLPVARDLADKQIRVVAIAPGIFDTPLMAGLPEPAQQSLATQVPHPSRLGQPPEFAALVRHVVENPYLNGTVIRLDGSIRMAPR